MLKTMSAALLAMSVMAAPALAGTYGRTPHAAAVKAEIAKSKALNANARMLRHHHKHHRHIHRHGHIGMLKHVAPHARRG